VARIVHIAVVLFLALNGLSSIASAFHSAWRLRTVGGPYFNSDVDFLWGILWLLAGIGVYRFEGRARVLATALMGFSCAALLGPFVLDPAFAMGMWKQIAIAMGPVLAVLWWLFSPGVRARFAVAKESANVT
jgi:hypothetical protein